MNQSGLMSKLIKTSDVSKNRNDTRIDNKTFTNQKIDPLCMILVAPLYKFEFTGSLSIMIIYCLLSCYIYHYFYHL